MKYTVITTFHDQGLKQYGQRMIDTFEQHWPAEVDLIIYAENCQPCITKSNVQVVEEMVNMITAQRAYELNSKAVTTSDQMLQKLTEL